MLYGDEYPDVDGRLTTQDHRGLPVRHADPEEVTYQVIFASLVAAVGGILFGYDIGNILPKCSRHNHSDVSSELEN